MLFGWIADWKSNHPCIDAHVRILQADDYDPAGWAPQLVIIYLGSNDYTGNLNPPSEERFAGAYASMVASILALYPTASGSPVPQVLHICGGESVPCSYIETVAGRTAGHYTTTFDTGVSKGGCIGHRNTTQQTRLARTLAPIINAAAGWS